MPPPEYEAQPAEDRAVAAKRPADGAPAPPQAARESCGDSRARGPAGERHREHAPLLAARGPAFVHASVRRDIEQLQDARDCGRIETAQRLDRRLAHLAEKRAAQVD